MTLCPIALAVGCRKCPAVSVCPLKGVIGDFKESAKDANGSQGAAKPGEGKSSSGGTGGQ